MSNRIDRSLGVKPYQQSKGKPAPKKRWSLKATTVLKFLIAFVLIAGAIQVLVSTNHCTQGVRCAD